MYWIETFSFLLWLASASASSSTDYYFENICSTETDIGIETVIESGTSIWDTHYSESQSCDITLKTDVGKKILLTWLYYDVEKTGSVCSDTLKIYNGANTLGTKLNTANCGSHTSSLDSSRYETIASTSNRITLHLVTNPSDSSNKFKFIATSFDTDDPCDIGEFQCNNDRCIDDSLTYDTGFDWEDNCGDWSDTNDWEDFAKAVGGILALGLGILIAVVVGSIVGGILICVCCGCLCYHLCCKKQPANQVTVVHAAPPPQNGVQVQTMQMGGPV